MNFASELLGRLDIGFPSAGAKINEMIAKHVHTRGRISWLFNISEPYGTIGNDVIESAVADSLENLIRLTAKNEQASL